MPESNVRQQQRLDALAKARLAKTNRVSTPKTRTSLKTVYLDDEHWVELAATHGIKLPNRTIVPTQGKLAPYLTKLGISRKQFADWCGYANPAEWIAKNSTFSLRALVGLLMEEF